MNGIGWQLVDAERIKDELNEPQKVQKPKNGGKGKETVDFPPPSNKLKSDLREVVFLSHHSGSNDFLRWCSLYCSWGLMGRSYSLTSMKACSSVAQANLAKIQSRER